MKEILFRGKAINRVEGGEYRSNYKNGDWVYGLVTRVFDERYKLPAEMTNTKGIGGIEVDYQTIGQYTGFTDKNGVKIFEGDIGREFGGETYQGCYEIDNVLIVKIPDMLLNFVIGYDCEREIIGNIHDNPELLKE